MRQPADVDLLSLINNTHDLVWSVDLDYRLVTFNTALQRHIEDAFAVRVAPGMRPQDFAPPERANLMPLLYDRVRAEGSLRVEFALVDKRILELAMSLIVSEGVALGISAFGKDITKQKAVVQALAESEYRFRGIFEENGSVMLVIDPVSGMIVNANSAASDYYGYPLNQLIGMKIERINIMPSENVAAERQRALSGERHCFQFRHRLASGEERDVEVYSSPVPLDGQQALFSIVHDVSDRKQMEKALRDNLDLLKEAQIIGGLGIYSLDFAAGMWTSSEVLDEIFGIDKEFERTVEGWAQSGSSRRSSDDDLLF